MTFCMHFLVTKLFRDGIHFSRKEFSPREANSFLYELTPLSREAKKKMLSLTLYMLLV